MMFRFVFLQAHSASAIFEFIESRTPETLLPYLGSIVSRLIVLTQVRHTRGNNIVTVLLKYARYVMFFPLFGIVRSAGCKPDGARRSVNCIGLCG